MPAPAKDGNVAAGANKVGRCCAAIAKRAETSLEFLYAVLDVTLWRQRPRVPFGFRPVQDRHRPLELHTMGPMTAARVSSTRSSPVTGRARPAPRSTGSAQPARLARLYRHRPRHRPRRVLGLAGRAADGRSRPGWTAIVAKSRQKSASRRPATRPIASIRPRDLVLDQQDAAARSCQRHGVLRLRSRRTGCCCKRIYYSIGGGFVVTEAELQRMKAKGR